VTSAVFGAAGLFLIGVAITLFTGQSAVRSGLRQTLFGVVSALVTFGVGHLIGVSIG
jgi:VIT1/CCC1 family predicted Fe2+/Mn2+ transporter